MISSDLKSYTKLYIIKHLSHNPSSNQELFKILQQSLNINYRSTVYAALKDLQKNGLVEKYYDIENNKIKYKLIVKSIKIDLVEMSIILC